MDARSIELALQEWHLTTTYLPMGGWPQHYKKGKKEKEKENYVLDLLLNRTKGKKNKKNKE